jgi:hypothetical protein
MVRVQFRWQRFSDDPRFEHLSSRGITETIPSADWLPGDYRFISRKRNVFEERDVYYESVIVEVSGLHRNLTNIRKFKRLIWLRVGVSAEVEIFVNGQDLLQHLCWLEGQIKRIRRDAKS